MSRRLEVFLSDQDESRREFLASLWALGSVAAVGGSSQSRRPERTNNARLIDVHHHVFPPEFVKATLDSYSPQIRATVSAWTVEQSLAEMDRNGVSTAVVSMTSPGGWFGDVQRSRSLSRACNEYSAHLVRAYPRRFGFFAAIPLPDAGGSLREIGYALDTLKADGINVMTSYDGKYLGDPTFSPVFEELNKRRAVVHVHPSGLNSAMRIASGVPGQWAELPQETTRTILSLFVSGSVVRWRDIRFIFSHAGGTMPMLAGRIAQTTRLAEDFAARMPDGLEQELKRLRYDIAVSADRSAMSALRNLVPTSQIVFGGDYPFVSIAATAGGMTNVGLSSVDLRAIGRDNALALFPQLKERVSAGSSRAVVALKSKRDPRRTRE
jgi:predicted TIM-barrel fold metal-dependent hydrolase